MGRPYEFDRLSPPPPKKKIKRVQILFDHWLLVELRGSDVALTSQKLLVVACGLRARLDALLSGALEEAERMKGLGDGNQGGYGRGLDWRKQPKRSPPQHREEVWFDFDSAVFFVLFQVSDGLEVRPFVRSFVCSFFFLVFPYLRISDGGEICT